MWQRAGEAQASDGFTLLHLGPVVTEATGPGSVPPVTSALTKAVQDVVKIVEIVVAVLHDGPVVHGVIEPAIGVCHGTRTGRETKGQKGRSQDNWSP